MKYVEDLAVEATGLRPEKFTKRKDFLRTVADAIDSMPDFQWRELPRGVQEWFNYACAMAEAKGVIPDFDAISWNDDANSAPENEISLLSFNEGDYVNVFHSQGEVAEGYIHIIHPRSVVLKRAGGKEERIMLKKIREVVKVDEPYDITGASESFKTVKYLETEAGTDAEPKSGYNEDVPVRSGVHVPEDRLLIPDSKPGRGGRIPTLRRVSEILCFRPDWTYDQLLLRLRREGLEGSESSLRAKYKNVKEVLGYLRQHGLLSDKV